MNVCMVYILYSHIYIFSHVTGREGGAFNYLMYLIKHQLFDKDVSQ